MPADVFGDLQHDDETDWHVDQHAESLPIGSNRLLVDGGIRLQIMTSSQQCGDNREVGTWHFSLHAGKAMIAQTQIPWCDLASARAQARAWAGDALGGAATVREDIAAIAGAEG